jgi:Arc/MetJ-type ribon-helix-helix transcriptional regulator
MNLEIHKPEMERRVREGIQSGRFHDADELLSRALDALSEKESSDASLPGATGENAGSRTIFEQGLGLFGSPEDAALLDDVVSIAYEERHRPTKQPPAF